MNDYQRALKDAAEVIDGLIRTWLDAACDEPEEERVGYPPFHLMAARNAVLALGHTEAETRP